MQKIKIAMLLLIIAITTGNTQSWSKVTGLDGISITTMLTVSDTLYVGSDTCGVMRKIGAGSWELKNTGLQSRNIQEITKEGSNLMAITDNGIYISTDKGTNWVKKTDDVPMGMVLVEGNGSTIADFYIGKTEVTQKQWKEVMTSNTNGISATPSDYGIGDYNPVNKVSWYDVLVFCNRLSIKEGLTPVYSISGNTNPSSWGAVPTSNNETWNGVAVDSNAKGYRLPKEAEWEYAAKGGKKTHNYTYAGSNTIEEVCWYGDNSSSRNTSAVVGTKQANELGLYDMSGNVWEWCYDWYPGYEGSYRVGRGGSWYDFADNCEVAIRFVSDPSYRGSDLGFRLTRAK